MRFKYMVGLLRMWLGFLQMLEGVSQESGLVGCDWSL